MIVRSTAAPAGAYLPAAPIAVAVGDTRPTPEVEWLNNLPPPARSEVAKAPTSGSVSDTPPRPNTLTESDPPANDAHDYL